MQVARAKRIVALFLAIGAAVISVVVLLSAGLVVLNAGSGADPADAFSEIPLLPEDLGELVNWQPDQGLVREVEPATRILIESTWVNAWKRIDTAHRTGSRELIDTWFMPNIAPHVAVSAPESPPAAVDQFGHTFEATFYSLDGSVLAMNVSSDLNRRFADGPALRTIENYEVVLLLSDGNWRIQHLTMLPETFNNP